MSDSEEIRFEVLPPGTDSRLMVDYVGPIALGEDFPPFMVRTDVLPVMAFQLATQEIRVAFDPRTRTLYVGETGEGGWMLQQARREAENGHPYPFQREVDRAEAVAANARRCAQRDRGERLKHAMLVARAVKLLRSPKSGVRRRARRLLEKLGDVR